jgi:hypothetical protein
LTYFSDLYTMVVLEAAAIGAAGYGLYKGGEAGVRKGRELQKEYQRESQRSAQRGELHQKTQARKDRISKIMSMRRGTNNNNSNHSVASATPSPPCMTSATMTTSAEPSWLSESSAPTSSRGITDSTNSTVEDRRQAVLAKLRASRKEEEEKKKKSGVFKNPFAKRK